MRRQFIAIVVMALLAAGAGFWWVSQPLQLRQEVVDVQVRAGETPNDIGREAVAAGVQTPDWLLGAWLSIAKLNRSFKAGSYEIKKGDTPRTLVRKLLKGEFAMRRLRIGEGWSLRQMREAMANAEALRPDTKDMDEAVLMAALGHPGERAEGRFFPDTYMYAKHSSDLEVLKLAMRTMDRKLEAAWAGRAPDLPLKTQYDLLTLASIVEKETGHKADREHVAAVFVNRLRIGMRLQTDPSVIYGMGEAYQGKIRRIDLETDTPYNTYTRAGLPPTPIAMPGEASLQAAAHPADSKVLYFVSRGDGTSEFSETLEAHNRAVNRYIRNR